MRKTFFLIALILVVLSNAMFGQTAHEVISGRGLAISSMVSVSNINNGDSHLVGIFKDGVLLAQLDNNTPQGLLSPSAKYFQLRVDDIVLNGGFYDEGCASFDYEDMYLAKRDEIQSLVREKQNPNVSEETLNKKSIQEVGNVEIIDNQSFVCKEFKGTCSYVVYDIYGRIVAEGVTVNGNYNDMNVSVPGLYLIKVTDEDNNLRINKIVVSEK